jgi:hypothetical protein
MGTHHLLLLFAYASQLRGVVSFWLAHHHPSLSSCQWQSQLHSSESSDPNIDMLRQRMERQESQYARLLLEQAKYFSQDGGVDGEQRPIPQSCHIVLFNPATPQQTAHTIEFPKNSGTNILLAFEDEVECREFAQMLTDLEFVGPSVSTTRHGSFCFVYC